ncbi:hypothetical protein AVEN_81840-1 [Araneus ventricosus]|uniref:Uncharacterized protein n=1 Tax=Araneus ventricosus TaxID=182803 RepID=A0A4Y2IFE6_ARAVE|nr:hypothetical protein AVEN_81840-1 [Araneus ventricosus]
MPRLGRRNEVAENSKRVFEVCVGEENGKRNFSPKEEIVAFLPNPNESPSICGSESDGPLLTNARFLFPLPFLTRGGDLREWGLEIGDLSHWPSFFLPMIFGNS